MIRLSYKHTVASCLIGSACQALICNFPPLLFLTFSKQYGIPLGQMTLIVTVNFFIQLLTDLVASFVADKVGYRFCLVLSHIMCFLGLTSLTILPELIDGIGGFVISAAIWGVGGGLLEVVASPAIEACPMKNKSAMMSFLHSCYCWGVVIVVVISSVFFSTAGTENWKIMTLAWSALPFLNAIYLLFVPMYTLPKVEEGKRGAGKSTFAVGIFWVFLLMMICAGASEQAVHQWSSTLAEATLKVDKTLGDLIGVCGFAIMMGIARVLYGKFSGKISPKLALMSGAALTVVSFTMIALAPVPVVGLLGCVLCGFSVGIFWPATLSVASANMPYTTTATFAFLALAGDVGCTSGPTVVGFVTDAFGGNFTYGIMAALIFPVGLFIATALVRLKKSKS